MEPLTPEHVYRMNVGLAQIESHDIDRFLEKVSFLDQDFHKDELIQRYPNERERLKACVVGNGKFSLFEMKALLHLLGATSFESADPAAMVSFFQSIKGKKALATLTLDEADQVMKSFAFSEGDYKNACTGKQIHGFIKSSYTRAASKEFKPWVDHQELIQTFPKLTKNWEQFYELLGHIVSKKHLFHYQGEEGYKVGTLIPCPPTKEGKSQWYRVSSCVHNGHGILSYTLEPACKDSQLEVIKLYRSTASDPYNMNAKASILNDINPLNSPGYMGTGLTDGYEKAFFGERTIPIWSAYEYSAEKILQKEELGQEDLALAFERLSQANKALVNEVDVLYRKQDIRSLLKKWDFVFIDLLFSQPSPLSPSERADIFLILNRYVYSKEGVQSEAKDDATSLFKILKKVSDAPGVEDLKKDLLNHVITRQGYDLRLHRSDELETEVLSEVTSFQIEAKSLLQELQKQNEPEAKKRAIDILCRWQERLQKHALKKNEHVSQKKKQSVSFSGHSLGGACAQRHLVHFYTDNLRVNVPGTKTMLRVFDEPAINSEDNTSFKEFGNLHHEVLKELDISFEIVRRHESFDIVTTAGEEHLGATFNPEETKNVSQWLRFDAAVQEPLSSAKAMPIRTSPVAHGTQFEEGQRQKGTIKQSAQQIIDILSQEKLETPEEKALLRMYEKLGESSQGDYVRSWFDTSVQGDYDRGVNQAYKHIWKVILNPHISEVLRSRLLGAVGSWFLNSNQAEPTLLQEQWQGFQDKKGCFAVDEKKGVISSQNHIGRVESKNDNT